MILLCALLLTGTAAPGRSLEEFERQLVRTPPVSTPFVEYRFSRMLKKPLRVSGTLEYRADGVLVRTVESPYRENTEITAEQMRIARDGRSTRIVALERAPQLRVVLGSFRALLEGNLDPLSRDFQVGLKEDAPRWILTLEPREAGLGKHLARIEVFGFADQLHCFEAVEPDGDASLTLFGSSPESPAPARQPGRAELESRCRLAAGPAAAGQ